ncbi:Major Facilitator Superfamily protein [Malonomonas rubra DSM 5091]|uniref:Major Facilitator Superfamily protein n=1 Tax=Malonomonas rubra DSM 5091 TaxID=1122189 RepID=A0A1M6HAN3_MALRU|nr:MFS transporter [Malonomonas rubra]SHJ19159.1 Major Facilitator Superfamily protein [Malonomonas rubra DSM 5091]
MIKALKKNLLGVLSGDDNLDRACSSIPAEACKEVSWNLRANVCNGAASKLAEQIAGPNLILPWLFQILGAPVWMFGFLLPIKQSFSLLPQMVVAGQIRRLAVRKWVWVGSGLVQMLCLLLMIPAALWFSPTAAGISLLLLLVVFSSASGTASVAFQDVLGKTVGKGHRGKLLAQRAFIGGILTTLAGFMLNRVQGDAQGLTPVLYLLFFAALLWALAALCFGLIRETPGAVSGGRNAIAEAREGIGFYRQYPGFRRFLTARGLLLTVELATPFFVLHAGQQLQLKVQDVGMLVVAVGFSQLISSPFWGKMADSTSRQVMLRSVQIAAAATFLALLLTIIPFYPLRYAAYLLVFVLIGLAESGVRLGRKTYLVDAVPQDERATYTAFSNSTIGLLAVASGLAGLVAQWFGPTWMLVCLLLLMLVAIRACRLMPEAETMLDSTE